MATGADSESGLNLLGLSISARNPGAPAMKNITNYHAYVRAVRSGEVEAVRQALERDPSYMYDGYDGGGSFLGRVTPLALARRRTRREINSLFDTFLLARLAVAGRRSGHLAAARRVFESKDMTRAIARFLARKFRSRGPIRAVPDYRLRDAGRFP
jgi:hypothetical protein